MWSWVTRCAASTRVSLTPSHHPCSPSALLSSLLLTATTTCEDGDDKVQVTVPDVMFSTVTTHHRYSVRDVMCAVRDVIVDAEMAILRNVGLISGGGEGAGDTTTTTTASTTSSRSVLLHHHSYDDLIARLETLRHHLQRQQSTSACSMTLTASAIAAYFRHRHTSQHQRPPPSEAMVEAVVQAAHLFCPPSSRNTTLLNGMLGYILGAVPETNMPAPSYEGRWSQCQLLLLPDINDGFLSRLIALIDSIHPETLASEALLKCWGAAMSGREGPPTKLPPSPPQQTQPHHLEEAAEWLWRGLIHQMSISTFPSDAATSLISVIQDVYLNRPTTTATFPLIAIRQGDGASTTSDLVGIVSAVLSCAIDTSNDGDTTATYLDDSPLGWVRITESAMVAVSQGWVAFGGDGRVVVVNMAPLLACLLG